MSEHTKTPWDLIDGRFISVHDNSQHLIAEARGGYSGSVGQANADAAFIVRACNSHEALESDKAFVMSCLESRGLSGSGLRDGLALLAGRHDLLKEQNEALVAALTACLCCEFPVTDREVIKQAGEALAFAKGAE